MAAETQRMDSRLQALAVGFALGAQQRRMCCAHHDIDRIGRGREHHGHGLDHQFDPLVRADQPEG